MAENKKRRDDFSKCVREFMHELCGESAAEGEAFPGKPVKKWKQDNPRNGAEDLHWY